MRSSMKRVLFILAVALLSSCGQGETELISGYKLLDLGGHSAISDPNNNAAVEADVIRYEVMDPFIVGERVYHDELSSPKYGYFILDTRSGQLLEGLNEAQFETALRIRKLNSSPFK
jgi:hypothetical protein